MADIDVRRVHDLGIEAARAAAERMARDLARKFDLKGDWEGNVLRFQRPGVTGFLAITGNDLRLSVSLGFLLKAMKGSIERAVMQELDDLFAEGGGASPPSAPTGRKAGVPPKKGG